MSTQNDNTEDTLDTPDELSTLKARADLLNVAYHPSIGLEKLREKVTLALSSDVPVEVELPSMVLDGDVPETIEEFHARKRKEAQELIRIRVMCMNPNKKEWDGELFTAGNAVVGSLTKYVPFNNDAGWHVPRIIYNPLVQRECQIFYAAKDARNNPIRKGKLIKEFVIEVMPPLTSQELAELAQRQAMANYIT